MTNDSHHQNLNAEEQSLVDTLDALGASNRAAPDHGFEHRLLDAIAPTLAPESIPFDPAPRRSSWRTVAAIAACLILAMSATIVFLPTSAQTGQPLANQTLVSLEEDLSAFEELGSLSESLDFSLAELDLLTDAMDSELANPGVFVEFNADPSPTGAI